MHIVLDLRAITGILLEPLKLGPASKRHLFRCRCVITNRREPKGVLLKGGSALYVFPLINISSLVSTCFTDMLDVRINDARGMIICVQAQLSVNN